MFSFDLAAFFEPAQTNEIRLPLRHKANQSPSYSQKQQPQPQPQPQSQQRKQKQEQEQEINPSLNQDTLKNLLKDHLTSLLTRGASTLNGTRTVINPPTVEIKQQIRIDSKLIEERCTKYEESNISSSSSSSTTTANQQIKSNQISCLASQQKSPFGLTVTPVDLSSQKTFQSVSLEKMAQKNFLHDNDSSSVSTSRPSTQPG